MNAVLNTVEVSGNGSTLTKASTQWASRPMDERFTSLIDLNDHCKELHHNSRSAVVSTRDIEAIPDGRDGLKIMGSKGNTVDVSHWAFGQICQRAKAPASYLRSLPAPMAADCLNYGLRFGDEAQDIQLLLTRRKDLGIDLRAATSDKYGRIYNSTISQALVDRFGDGVNGQFTVPKVFGKREPITKQNTTLYAGDRDMFVFLADEDRRIPVYNRRNGEQGSLARGFFVWNSEVGSATFGIGMFLFDYVCQNRIVWGAQGYQEIKIRHTKSAPHRWIEEIAPAIISYSESSMTGTQALIAAAQAKRIDDLDAFLAARRFTASQISGIRAAHAADEGRPIETLWDLTTGMTAYARDIPHQADRVDLERAAGKVLQMAA